MVSSLLLTVFLIPLVCWHQSRSREEPSLSVPDWDIPLPEGKWKKWEAWIYSVQDLKQLHVLLIHTQTTLSNAVHTELCVFLDASTKRYWCHDLFESSLGGGEVEVGFIMGNVKLAPVTPSSSRPT